MTVLFFLFLTYQLESEENIVSLHCSVALDSHVVHDFESPQMSWSMFSGENWVTDIHLNTVQKFSKGLKIGMIGHQL